MASIYPAGLSARVAGRLLFTLACLAVLAGAVPMPARAAADLLPDLAMAPLRDVRLQVANGRRLLRFTAEIINVGAGPFELHGARSPTEDDMTSVTQRVYDDAGGWRERATVATMFFAGDGHLHWHVRNLERYELQPLDSQHTLGAGAKSGFCFSDTERYAPQLPASPAARQYASCGRPGDLSVTMGLSVGWGDVYDWTLPDQYIDVTDLPPGRYRLSAVADPDGWFLEADAANNATTLDILIADGAAFLPASQLYLPAIRLP
jgi:hypothetical protein